MARRIVHWLLSKITSKGKIKMINFDRENRIRILSVMGNEDADVVYSIDGGESEIIGVEDLLFTPAKFCLIEKAASSTELERKNLMHLVIRLSFIIMGKVSVFTPSRSERMNVIYNVIWDRYCLPIPMARVSESVFTGDGFQSFVEEINDLITKTILPEENNDSDVSATEDEKELTPDADEPIADYLLSPLDSVEPYNRNLTLMMKGLSKEQCDNLVALAVAYIVENNLQSDNCSSLTIK